TIHHPVKTQSTTSTSLGRINHLRTGYTDHPIVIWSTVSTPVDKVNHPLTFFVIQLTICTSQDSRSSTYMLHTRSSRKPVDGQHSPGQGNSSTYTLQTPSSRNPVNYQYSPRQSRSFTHELHIRPSRNPINHQCSLSIDHLRTHCTFDPVVTQSTIGISIVL
ncbi:3881_t:CDS:2, partial [Acaulospora colombiana]